MIKTTTVSILKYSKNMFYMDTWMDRQELEIWLELELRENEKWETKIEKSETRYVLNCLNI